MRGEVEIWDGEKLIHKEHNLLVDGAGELLADIMTVSPSLAEIEDHATSSILDASNYTIQAISFGKDASAYSYNAHKYHERRNLAYDSTLSAASFWLSVGTGLSISSTPEVTNPPGFEDIPSSIAHTTAFIDQYVGANSTINAYTHFQGSNFNLVPSALQDKWVCASMYIKAPVPDYPLLPGPFDPVTTTSNLKTEWKPSIRSADAVIAAPFIGMSRAQTLLFWREDQDGYFVSSMRPDESQTDARDETAGFTEDNWRGNGGCQEVGNGWYRVWQAIPAPSAADHFLTLVWPAGWEAPPLDGETSGGIYSFGYQVEVGKWPTPLQFNYGFIPTGWDVSGSVLNQWYGKYGSDAFHPEDKGTVRVLNERKPNPNLLFYTDDPGSSPGIDFHNNDPYGYYWTVGNAVDTPTFSSILETNPFGGESSVEISANPSLTDWSRLLTRTAPEVEGFSQPPVHNILFSEDYWSVLSFYVKKPPSNATSSLFTYHYDPDSPAQTNRAVFEFAGGGTELTVKEDLTTGSFAFVEAAGNDWYRLTHAVSGLGASPSNTQTGDRNRVYIYQGDSESGYVGTEGTRLWLYGFQLEQNKIGSLEGSSASHYQSVAGAMATEEEGYTPSSYTPINYLSSPPNPQSTRVEERSTTLETFSGIFSGMDMGQNLNMVPWRSFSGNDTQLRYPSAFSGYQEPPKAGSIVSSIYPERAQAGYQLGIADTSGVGTLGNQAYYLGCYPEGSSTGGSNWVIVSALDSSTAYDNNIISGTYNSIVNEASSMDAFGFVGKVYDAKKKVGDIPNPNRWQYTRLPEDDPGITINSDLVGNFWTFGADRWGSVSAIQETNPFGGPSSIELSATGNLTALDFWPIMSTTDAANVDLSATHRISFSTYVKQPTGEPQGITRFGINIYNHDTLATVTQWYDFSGISHGYSEDGVPVWKDTGNAYNAYTSHAEESVGNGWWRVAVVLSGLGDVALNSDGDRIRAYFYLADADGVYTSVAGSSLWISSPQWEQHSLETDLSTTPFQEVLGTGPLTSENQGLGGLHVSGGVDATNSGTVEYSITVGSGDVGYSNLYGGIYNMGLWTIDMDKTLKAGNTPPYSFGPLNNPRKYKLFSTKHLTQNLGYIKDNITETSEDAGALNYSDLTIKWRLHFL